MNAPIEELSKHDLTIIRLSLQNSIDVYQRELKCTFMADFVKVATERRKKQFENLLDKVNRIIDGMNQKEGES